jgi:hypothetical protein
MQSRLLRSLFAGAVLVGFVACSETSAPSVITDEDITTDVAMNAGDAVVTDITQMLGSESFAGMSGSAPAGSPPDHPPLNVTRSRTCYDAAGSVQAQCDQATTASVLIQLSASGTISFTDSVRGVTVTGSTARARKDSISGLAGTETSRTHNGSGSGLDSLTISGSRGTRASVESSNDTTDNIVFNLPRSSNPWPASGRIIRNVTGSVSWTGGDQQGTRSFTRRVVVQFPADSQGNVTITINDHTCNLNLVTRRVTNCS